MPGMFTGLFIRFWSEMLLISSPIDFLLSASIFLKSIVFIDKDTHMNDEEAKACCHLHKGYHWIDLK